MDSSDLTKILRLRRKAKKHRQQDIARWAGLTQSELSNIENGHVDIRVSTLKRIVDALDLKIIVIPKEKLEEVEGLLTPTKAVLQTTTSSELLDKYGISDEDD